jgi:ABC-type sugar transport system ATPase subunit
VSEAAIETERLVAAGPGHAELDGLSLVLPRGKVTCVLTDSRASGSLLVAVLAGLASLTSGTLTIDGRKMRQWSPGLARRTGIGAAGPGLALLPGLPAWRSLILGREQAPSRFWPILGDRRAQERLAPCLTGLGLAADVLARTPEELAPSLQRMLLVARAFADGKLAVLLDEPTTGLGVEAAAQVLRRIAEARDAGSAVLLVTPNVQHVWAVGDQFILVYAGRTLGVFARGQTSREELHRAMLGNQDFQELAAELSRLGATPPEVPQSPAARPRRTPARRSQATVTPQPPAATDPARQP